MSLDKELTKPTCECCDNVIKYVLDGCTPECGFSECCTCKIEVVNHNADEFVVEDESKQIINPF